MAIVLTEYEWPAKVVKSGSEAGIELTVGQHLKIETTPGGLELLDAVVPAGKAWSVRVIVEVEEMDA